MTDLNSTPRDSFGSKFGVIAAAAGSAIGLGNIWRFPYVLGENGGGAFLLIYLLFILIIGIPVMLSEFVIGRRAQRNPYGAFKKLAPGTPWFFVGFMGVVAAFMILAFYTAVAGWTLEYIYQSIINGFGGKSPNEINTMFETFRQGSFRPILWFVIFMFLSGFIVASGVKKGIERYAKLLMPILLVLIVVMCVRSVTLPGASAGLEFLFKPDFSKITANTILEALGQAFFSLSIGMGTLITYGSYINRKENLGSTAFQVSIADTFIAVLAGVAIFPAVFAFGIAPSDGEGLVYKTLPNIFQQMTGGYYFSLLFFLLLGVAALTSTISVLEVIVAYFVEQFKLTRKKAVILASVSVGVLGISSVMSWTVLSSFTLFGLNVFGILDFASANIFLPLGGLLIVVFVGWYLGATSTKDELSSGKVYKIRYFGVFRFIVRFIAPIAIAMVFLNGLDLIKF